MDWIAVAKMIAPMAPVLGGVLGGFIPIPGGALAGQAVGNLIASAFGVPATPAAVAGAVQASPNEVILAKLTAAADEARSMWPAYAQAEQAYAEAQTKMADTVNVTMRAELANENLFYTGWRPSCGWLFVVMSSMFGFLLIWATAKAIDGDPSALTQINAAWPIYAAYLGGLAVMVGVYTVSRSKEKVALTQAITPDPPAATIASLLKKK